MFQYKEKKDFVKKELMNKLRGDVDIYRDIYDLRIMISIRREGVCFKMSFTEITFLTHDVNRIIKLFIEEYKLFIHKIFFKSEV